MRDLPHFASLIFNQPQLIAPAKGDVIVEVFGPRLLAGEPLSTLAPPDAERNERKAYRVVDGVAVINVAGTLVHKARGLSALSGLSSYMGIRSEIEQAQADDAVGGILLEIDSGGGAVPGCFQLVDWLGEAVADADAKPIWGYANEAAYSAAYAIASACDRVLLPETGAVGSVGVITYHVDRSKADKERGLSWTAIHAGQRKADGWDRAPLDKAAHAAIQERIDAIHDVFVAAVARGRDLSEAAVRETEAGIFTGSAAIEVGFADAVQSFDETLAEMAGRFGTKATPSFPGAAAAAPSIDSQEESSMEKTVDQAAPAAAETPAPDQEQDLSAQIATARAEGASAEKDRIAAILTHEEAQGREAQARTLAIDTDLDAAAAAKVLAASPKAEEPKAEGPGFEQAMAEAGNPDVGVGEEAEGDEDPAKAAAAAVEATRKAGLVA